MIGQIDYKLSKLKIIKNDNSKYQLTMTKLEYSVIQETKNVVDKIANDKNISINLDS